jgi:filamentous hemagglutinin family protein
VAKKRKKLLPHRLRVLQAGVSATALLVWGALTPSYASTAAQLLSPAGLAQASAQHTGADQTAASQAGPLANPAVQAQIALSKANLAKAAQALKSITAAQTAASAAAQLTLNNAPLSGSAWNGTALSGLNPVDDTDNTLWINADPLSKNVAKATATVKQTAATALLTWQSFDLNKGETLIFDQQGHADWTVLNRVVAGPRGADGSRFVASPTYILGSIKAAGSVYVIDPNGIIFGPNSQINVHSLIASSLDVGNATMTLAERNSFFLNQGITSVSGQNTSFSYDQQDQVVEGDVTVDAGASITASLAPRSVSPDSGGFVYLIAPNVENDGTIKTPAGEILMLAAQQVQLLPNNYALGGQGSVSPGVVTVPTFRAVGPNLQLNPQDTSEIDPWRTDGVKNAEISAPGAVVNTGLLDADRGVIILNGDDVTNGALVNQAGVTTQVGVIRADTSITRNSEIFLDARLKLTIADGSSIQIMPDENGETIPESAILASTSTNPSFLPGAVEMSGNTVDIESGGLVIAPGGMVSVTGVAGAEATSNPVAYPSTVRAIVAAESGTLARIYMAPDSTIDVSGLDGVTLPVSANLVSFKPFGNEFADQPLQRNGALRGVELTVDIRDTGTIDGVPWIGTPLADVIPLAEDVPLSLDQLLTTGGTVSLTSSRADQIILRKDSTIDVAGGYVQYQGGVVNTTKLLTATGQIVNIADANPLQTYVGVSGMSSVEHPHWGANTTQTFINPLLSQGVYEPSYVEGHDAGGITLGNPTQASIYALDGKFVAGVIIGERQAASGIRPSATTANTDLAPPTDMPSAGFLDVSGFTNLAISNDVTALPDSFAVTSRLPSSDASDTAISADLLTQANFGSISMHFSGNLVVAPGANASVTPGGSISLTAGSIDVEGDLTARSGSISLETTSTQANNVAVTLSNPQPPNLFNLTIGSNADLNASGMWVNDSGANPEQLVGGAYVDGGAISLKTDTAVSACASTACKGLAGLGTSALVDITGNIILDAGSRLDLSSGGRIGLEGKFQTNSNGTAVGNGGSLTLETYATGFRAAAGVAPTTTLPSASIIFQDAPATASGTAAAFNAIVDAYGFSSGGKLTIQTPGIQVVAGDGPSGTGGAITLPDSFFTGNGFGEYDLLAVAGGLSIAPGANIVLRQQNYVPDAALVNLATGTNIQTMASVGYLPEVVRAPVNLVLSSTLAPLPSAPYTPPADTTPLPPQLALTVGAGAVIQADPQAAVSVSVNGRVLATVAIDGSVVGNIAPQNAVADIEGTIIAPSGSITVTGGVNSQIWLGAQSRLDASGVAVQDTRQTAFDIGSVLPGGTVSIVTLDSSAAIIAVAGSQIDVSGSAATFDVPQDGGIGSSAPVYTPTTLWSDAGSVTLSAATLLYDGRIIAAPGAPQANGGSLTVSLPTDSGVLSVQTGDGLVPATLTPTSALTSFAGQAVFQADDLPGSGIANLTLAAGTTQGALSPSTVQFNGNISIGGLNSLTIDASVVSLADSPKTVGPDGCNVCLSANYIAFQGSGSADAQAGRGILKATAGMIDINAGGSAGNNLSFAGVAATDLVSTGDIRLGMALANLPSTTDPGSLLAGELITNGNLTLQAEQIYPVTDVDFTLKATGHKSAITFLGNGTAASAPLSAGGQVTVDAVTIDQAGTLLAPLGTIRLGARKAADLSPNDDTPVVVTANVTLAPGSITSVSLNGLIVPYGQTTDDKNLSYDSNVGLPLTQAPQKSINIASGTIDLQSGATVDLSGGGDIQASEFVQGTGGTRDVLANNPNVFAIIPGYNPKAAPVDPNFITDQGDTIPAAGSAVYLSGSPGLPAGYYTLLPAHYATLPGAYRVEMVANSQDARVGQNTVLPDGTLQVAGYLANPTAGTRAARTMAFDVQSSAVWRQYSEIDETSGNTYFSMLAQSSGSAARLPEDAGHIVIDGLTAITLDATVLAAPATGGRGAEFDIAGSNLQILSPGDTAAAGYVGLETTQLSSLAVDSLLIGGVRTDGADGEIVTVTADSVRVSNDTSSPLDAPELILVANAPAKSAPPNTPSGVIIDPGSVITASGTVAATDPTKLIVHGDGAFLSLSSGALVSVSRLGGKGTTGTVSIGSSVKFAGASLTLNAGNVVVSDGSTFSVQNIAIASSSINFGQAPAGQSGLVLEGATLASLEHADTLSLSSLGAANFYGGATIALDQPNSSFSLDATALVATGGGTVTIDAGTVILANGGAASAAALAAGTATLQITAQDVQVGAGDKTLRGFASVRFVGKQQIALNDSGSLSAGSANLTFDSPVMLVSTGATQAVTTAGAVEIQDTSAAKPVTAAGEIGGTFTLKAGSITDNSLIQATAGGVTLEASTGDIALGAQAKIVANGYAQAFFDVTRVASGGAVQLISDTGNITIAKGAAIDISSAAGFAGHAGALTLSAANGTISTGTGAFDAGFVTNGVAHDSGGSLSIDAQSIGGTTVALPSIFSDTIDLHIQQGDFHITSALTAQNVTVTDDQGTLTVASAIDASGTTGGTIQLFGGQGVIVTADGRLRATASDAAKRGGDVVIGTEVASDNGSGHDGVIDLKAGTIDVANTANAANGGTVRLRAPLIGSGNDVAIDTVGATITGASSVTVEAFKVFDAGKSGFTGVIDPAKQGGFYGTCNAQGVCSGTLIDFVQNFALSAASQKKFGAISSDILHLQPGIELVNSNTSINNGDITVASAWNLGAGNAGFLVNSAAFKNGSVTVPVGTVVTDKNGTLLPQYAGYTGALAFVQGVSQITNLFYRVGGSVTGEAGTLTLRATRDVVINASITDGFFQTEDRLNPTYLKQAANWVARVTAAGATPIATNVGGYIVTGAMATGVNAPPLAPYIADANLISPTQTTADPTPIAGADLFPLVADPNGPIQGTGGNYSAIQSWSYRVTAGADTASANPLAVRPLAVFADGSGSALAGHGNVTISGHTSLSLNNLDSDGIPVSLNIPTIVRTGTGSIDIAAARDFILADTTAPGVVYTAGRSSVALPDPDYKLETVADPLNPGGTIKVPVATNPNGFLTPQLVSCDAGSAYGCNPYGPITQAAYPVDGGHLTVTVQQDILGYEHPTIKAGDGSVQPNQQYFAPWLIAQGTKLTDTEFGIFSALSGYVSNSGPIFTPSQTSWWINFGSFDQGLMSVGGDVRIVAGRDISQLSVSLPTTARVSGGLSSTTVDAKGNVVANVPVMHLNASGDLTVIAGRNIESGAFYEGSGQATITAGGSVLAGWSAHDDPTDPTSPIDPVSTVLAVDTGSIVLQARGSIDIAGVVSAISLQNVADRSGNDNPLITSTYLSSYGPKSAVTLLSVGGDVTTNSLSNPLLLIENEQVANGVADVSAFPGNSAYPASFEAVSLRDDVTVANALQLAPSNTGTINLLAYGSLTTESATNYQNSVFDVAYGFQALSTGPSIVEQTFNPTQPLAGFGPPAGATALDLGPLLLHQGNTTPDLFYAATGDIMSGQGAAGLAAAAGPTEFPLSWEVTKTAQVHAGQDIIDLPFFGQNLAPTDVTQIIAGRDIFYTGALALSAGIYPSRPVLSQPENAAGLSLAGPGFFDVEAGRNLGPFVTAVADEGAIQTENSTDETGTGIITFGDTVTVGNRLIIDGHDINGNPLDDPFATGQNFLLPREGADITALFGVGKGADYQAVIRADINPATATSTHNYGPDLVTFLQTLGLKAQTTANAWKTFQTLSAPLQHVFVEKVFFSELNQDGTAQNFAAGYNTVNALFPTSLGYTNNGPNGDALVNQVETGDLEMLHATIKTLQATTIETTDPSTGTQSSVAVGGDVMILGPGGSVTVGSQAVEINPFLTASALGILTLDNGVIDTFTDGGLLVNESRVLTVQGGDIILWSSNGDLDAGRGAKTSVDFRPLSVNFDTQDLQTINLNGLVSGAGIGTIQSTPDAPPASASLIAPRGTVNAGDAGLRSSGNLAIIALRVLNAANISSLGTVSGVPQANSVNLGALESATGTAGGATQAALDSVTSAANKGSQNVAREPPSLITVEVLGFGDCDPEAGKKCQE